MMECEESEDEVVDSSLPYPAYLPKVFYCMSQHTPPRKWFLALITWPWFERISMAVILLNCLTLGMYQPCVDEVCNTVRCKVLAAFDHFIFAFFVVEMCIKILAMGFFGKKAYLSETWNRLDMFIVIAGILEYGLNTENFNLSAIRTIRVLRPLRAINRIPSLRILVTLLLDTLPMLGNVLLLSFFVFFIFGIIGVQLWAGMLRNRCFHDLPDNISRTFNLPDFYRPVGAREFVCSEPEGSGMAKCANLPRSVLNGVTCNLTLEQRHRAVNNVTCVNWNQYYTSCRPSVYNPFHGGISFDNIGLAWVAIFQVISLAGWVNVMYYVQDAHTFWAWAYFVALIVIGAFFMLNLCLVVIATQFSETKKRETDRMKLERKRFHSSSTLGSLSEPGGCYDEIVKLIGHLYRQVKRKANRLLKQVTRKRQGSRLSSPTTPVTRSVCAGGKGPTRAPRASPELSDVDSLSSPHTALHPNEARKTTLSARQATDTDCATGKGCATDPDNKHNSLTVPASVTFNTAVHVNSHVGNTIEESVRELEDDSDMDSDESDRHEPSQPGFFTRFRLKLKQVVDGKHFQRAILAAILVNTLSMGIEFHGQPDELTEILEYSNIIFSTLFAIEMLLKVLAYGPLDYLKNGFNVFDGFIVVLSGVELVQGGTGGLSVLRTFRLLRILKLVRFMPALRQQLVIMLKTMDNVATFFALLMLFIFIFSILGMHLFGGKLCEHPDGRPCTCAEVNNATVKCKSERKNFDSLLWSLVTVFQILTQEDWNEVLYNGMEKTSSWAAMYFVALMTFGNYVLFNLLVAILVEGFASDGEEEEEDKGSSDTLDAKVEHNNYEKNYKDINIADKDIALCKCKKIVEPNDVKNNKNKEMLLLYGPECMEKRVSHMRPPIIIHTAATPLVTPHSSPKTVSKIAIDSSLLDSLLNKQPPVMSMNNTPKPSPGLQRKSSKSTWLSILKQRELQRAADSDSAHEPADTVQTAGVSADSHSVASVGAESDVDVNSTAHSDDCSNAGTPISDGVVADAGAMSSELVDPDKLTNENSGTSQNDSPACDVCDDVAVSPMRTTTGECNGLQLNNQRVLSPPSCSQLPSRQSSFRCQLSRHNSFASSQVSRKNSVNLGRQNSCASGHSPVNGHGHSVVSGQNSLSGSGPAVFTQNNLSSCKVVSIRKRKKSTTLLEKLKSHLPEPKGCFVERREYALYLLAPNNWLRKLCQWIITRRWFDYSILFFIALNCITLAMERPDIPPNSLERDFLTVTNCAFTVIFALEMFLKVCAMGLVVGYRSYLHSGWNVMDGILVVISLVDILLSLTASSHPRIFGILRVFRLLRTLRPLRVISRAPGLKLVVQTLLSSLRPIGNIVLICCTFFIIFGILGVQLFKGSFYYCKGPEVDDIKNKTDCLDKGPPYQWVNRKYHFDNLGRALMSLFVLASKDGWVGIMYTGLDAVGENYQPIQNYNEWRLLYFISFLLLVGFFVLNMFVGVVVENFHKCRESQEKEENARRAAKRARSMEKKRNKIKQVPYWVKYSRTRLVIHTVINSKYFDLAIAAVIGLNVITMALEYYRMPEELQFALKVFNYFFTSVFILEAIVKVVALGFVRYFSDRWNRLDVAIVILSLIGIVLEEMKSGVIPINPTIIRVMRVLRIARVLKLLKMANGIRALLDTVGQALPQIGNLGLLFFLLFFIFAALGVELFGRLECSVEEPCEGLSEHAHFRNFGMAFLTLFRVATGDNWNGIMKDTLRDDCEANDSCMTPIVAPLFFVVFVLMAQFVLINVVVAVLMKHLEESNKHMDDEADMDEEIEEEMRNLALQQSADLHQHGQKNNNVLKAAIYATEQAAHKPVLKQLSLPTKFAFHLDPPTPVLSSYNIATDDEHYHQSEVINDSIKQQVNVSAANSKRSNSGKSCSLHELHLSPRIAHSRMRKTSQIFHQHSSEPILIQTQSSCQIVSMNVSLPHVSCPLIPSVSVPLSQHVCGRSASVDVVPLSDCSSKSSCTHYKCN